METQEEKTTLPAIKPDIAFEDFMKMDIRICQILSVEKVEKYDKLYKLEIDTGIDKRIVVSAIAHIFDKEELMGMCLPFILNLPVRKIAKIDSHGMIILAEDTLAKKTLMMASVTKEDSYPGKTILGVGSIVV